MSFQVTDAAEVTALRTTRDGYLVAEPRFARVGIQVYGGMEVGRPEMPLVRLYRSEDAVFDQKAMASFAHRPVTNDHPSVSVNPENWREHVIGFTGDTVTKDGGFVRIPMMLADANSIQDVRDGKVELSAGYTVDIDWTAGTTPDGEPFDGSMINLRGNHIALVAKGRAGHECRIGDAALSAVANAVSPTPIPTHNQRDRTMPGELRTVLVDGLSIEVTTQGAQIIDRLQDRLRDAAASTATVETRLRDAETAHRSAVDAATGQVAALRVEMARATETHQGEVAGLRTSHQSAIDAAHGQIEAMRSQTSDAALDARVAQRATLIGRVKPILGDAFNPSGLSYAAIRRAVVVQAMGAALTDADAKGEAFYDAAFEAVMATGARAPARPDPLRAALAAGPITQAADAQAQIPPWKRAAMRAERAHLTTSVQGA